MDSRTVATPTGRLESNEYNPIGAIVPTDPGMKCQWVSWGSSKVSDPSVETENAAPDGPRNGAKSDFEVGELPPHNSPLWAGAPSIIRLHFCGVVA